MAEQRSKEGMQKKLEYIADYNKAAYDRVELKIVKGAKAQYKAVADAYGLSLTALFVTAVDEYIQRHQK
ncbi:hypothetical protein [Selenomonas ruminantium]|uniref:Antitoxin n=1 Tax=Selenomonas ruminantium TaxID=971 RepID=A0A1I0VJ37_SELRU|nr:hypothetical protein [Selenomonas ruminantium]SFA76043.1 hypothetical protein SAMN05216587_101640 [Selenomonas ruminantium]